MSFFLLAAGVGMGGGSGVTLGELIIPTYRQLTQSCFVGLRYNTAGQEFHFLAVNTSGRVSGIEDTITCELSIDGGTAAPLTDLNPTEIGSSGEYIFDLTRAETAGANLSFRLATTEADTFLFGMPSSMLKTTRQQDIYDSLFGASIDLDYDWTPGTSVALLGWYDFSATGRITSAANLVSAYTEISGNSPNMAATGSDKPSTGVSTINGLNVLDCNGTQWLTAATPPAATTAPAVVAITFLPASLPTTGTQALWSDSGGTAYIGLTPSGFVVYAGTAATFGTPVVDTITRMIVVFDGANSRAWINGVEETLSTNPGAAASIGSYIGSLAGVNGFIGSILEVIQLDDNHTTDDLGGLLAYQLAKVS